jgi:CDP-4-dehydro-6-deoxyglucose reductase
LSYTELAPELRHFEFDVPETDALVFAPGQFLSFAEELGGKKITRAYSIASAPRGNRFSLCLNRVKDGRFSPHLFELEPGQTVEFRGPYGVFTLRNPPSDSVFIATGTGIAPFRGMLQQHLSEHPEKQFTLIFGVRFELGILYREEFEAMQQAHPNFHFWPTLTQPGTHWTGRTGRVQNHILQAVGDRREVDMYICGLKAMVDDVRQRLKDLGFERRRIIFEKYD